MTIWPRLLLNEAGCNRDAGKGALDRLRRDRGAIAMEERGGPTTQAGIRYQNSVAALYLGDLLRWDIPHPAKRAREIRLEAPRSNRRKVGQSLAIAVLIGRLDAKRIQTERLIAVANTVATL
jgi:hypothetical protein